MREERDVGRVGVEGYEREGGGERKRERGERERERENSLSLKV